MGVLRLLLALSVIRDHRPFFEYFFLIRGGVAVIFFYMISGFYMSMVITEKYSKEGPGWERNFLWHRALRLFPCYWAVLIFTLIAEHLMGKPTIFSSALGLGSLERILLIFSNIFIVGQDILISGATLHWHGASGGIIVSWAQFPVLVAWTVSVEITFYLLAAFFILRSTRIAIFALVMGLYFRIYFLIVNGKMLNFTHDGLGYSNTPWGYHFFGIALIYFMCGWLAYKLYVRINTRIMADLTYIRTVRVYALALSAALLLMFQLSGAYQIMGDYNDYRIWLTIPLVIVLIPHLFAVTKRSKLDNYIGMFSYPLYLCHVIATDVGVALWPSHAYGKWLDLLSVAVVSTLLVVLVEVPMESVRKRLGGSKKNLGRPQDSIVTAPGIRS